MANLRDQTVIAGVGQSPYSRASGVSTLTLAVMCAKDAMLDAGLAPQDIDGMILYYLHEPLECHEVAANLGIPELRWSLNLAGGGNLGGAVVMTAAAAIAAGFCNNVICLHAINRRSVRRGQGGRPPSWTGYVGALQNYAMKAQRHMVEYGTKQEHFGQIAVSVRKHAILNPIAIMREPITLEDYHHSRWISTPFHLFDCCLESDGGAACVVTSADRAQDMKKPPVYVMAGVANAWHPARSSAASQIWEKAGVGPKDMHFAQFYDAFTYAVLSQLEDYGFCNKGEGWPFVEGGRRIELGGEIPINTSGGQLSEAYLRTMSLINEAVRQLRHEYEGTPRQVEGAEMGLVTSAPPSPSSALVLRR